jgi:hypothetical protein
MYLASPQTAALDAEVSGWIASPTALAQLEQDSSWNHDWAYQGILHLAAEAFFRLGRDGEAAEAASLCVAPQQHVRCRVTLAGCHSVLARVAAKRGDLEEAGGHFMRQLEAAKASRCPLLEVLAARDWKRAVSESGAAADALIDAACAKMGKSREQLAPVL